VKLWIFMIGFVWGLFDGWFVIGPGTINHDWQMWAIMIGVLPISVFLGISLDSFLDKATASGEAGEGGADGKAQ
jgi:hypothetical protein